METSILVPPQDISVDFADAATHTLCPICGGQIAQNGPIARCLLCRYTYCESCEGDAPGERGCFPIG